VHLNVVLFSVSFIPAARFNYVYDQFSAVIMLFIFHAA